MRTALQKPATMSGLPRVLGERVTVSDSNPAALTAGRSPARCPADGLAEAASAPSVTGPVGFRGARKKSRLRVKFRAIWALPRSR